MKEESVRTLFAIACEDWSWYYTTIIPDFMKNTLQLKQHPHEMELLSVTLGGVTDHPSFERTLTNFIQDYKVLSLRSQVKST